MRLAGRGFASTMLTCGLLGTGASCAAAWGTGTVAACAGKGLASTAPTLCLLPSSDSATNACTGTFRGICSCLHATHGQLSYPEKCPLPLSEPISMPCNAGRKTIARGAPIKVIR